MCDSVPLHDQPSTSTAVPSTDPYKQQKPLTFAAGQIISGGSVGGAGASGSDSNSIPQAFCLRWNNYQTNLTAVFEQLLQTEQFVDVTLSCDGISIKAHKIVLSACSPYFQALFNDNPCKHPIIIMRDIKFAELKAVIEFMYRGEINVCQDQIGPLLRIAELLKIRGLADVNADQKIENEPEAQTMQMTSSVNSANATSISLNTEVSKETTVILPAANQTQILDPTSISGLAQSNITNKDWIERPAETVYLPLHHKKRKIDTIDVTEVKKEDTSNSTSDLMDTEMVSVPEVIPATDSQKPDRYSSKIATQIEDPLTDVAMDEDKKVST